jgi:membrane protein DedA with SNARE-associated domain
MQNLAHNGTQKPKFSLHPNAARIVTVALLVVACTAPLAIQQYLSISPELVGAIGIPAIILFGFIGSVTVVLPVPVLSLVFAGATILNPITLVVAAAASITAGMAVCYIMGKRGHSRAVRAAETSQQNFPAPITNLYLWSTENVGTASFLVAATPNPVFDYAGFIAGAGRMNAQRFLAGTFAGKITQASVIAFLGHTMGERITSIL